MHLGLGDTSEVRTHLGSGPHAVQLQSHYARATMVDRGSLLPEAQDLEVEHDT